MLLDALLEQPAAVAADPEVLWAAVHAATEAGADWTAPPTLAEPAVADALRREVVALIRAPPDVIVSHIDRVLLSPTPARGLDLLQRTGVLAVLLPEVEALVGFHRSAESHHKDLWDHTRQVIGQMPPDADLRWAALLHDAGKIATRVVERPGVVTFWHHEALGAWLMRGVGARLEIPGERAERIGFVIANHGRVNAYEPAWTDRAVRRLVAEMAGRLDDLVAFSKADVTTRRASRRQRIRQQLDHLQERLLRLQSEANAPRLPSGLGTQVAAATGLEGPALGEAMSWLRDELVAGRIGAEPDGLLAHLKRRRPPGN